ncbi:Ground-like domain protein [Dirofilaria immitis]|nr:Ground-like domain protein [Dirofilaria immitis]
MSIHHLILLLIPVTAISLNSLKSNCSCQPSSPCSTFCSDGSFDNSDKKIGSIRSRILKRSAIHVSLEDDSDLIKSPEQNATINQRNRRNYGISDKHIVDKNQPKLSKMNKSHSEPGTDIKCNSRELKELMLENISENSSASKRAINDQAEAKFGGSIDVICSKGHFSYVYSSNLYCEATKGNVTCIAFRQSF